MNTLIYTLGFLASAGAIVHLLIYKREPSSTVAWILFVLLVPFFGPLLFVIFGPQRIERQAIKRKKEITRTVIQPAFHFKYLTDDKEYGIDDLTIDDQQVFELARRISSYPVTTSNGIKILHDPSEGFNEILRAISEAKHFIHVEYYIIESDEITQKIFDGLEAAVKRGVEVRVLYDAVGSVWLKSRYFKKLKEAGAKIAGFLPFSLLPRRMYVNFRNHRKIFVVDGKVAFTGGTNIGRHYFGFRSEGQGEWHDFSVRVEGPACRQLEDVFSKDWHFTTQEDLFSERYYPDPVVAGDSIVQVIESGPDSTFQAMHQAMFLAISSAKEEILLTTPYFVPDPAIATALTVAALRGVKVQIILPLKNDSKLVQHASRSFYDTLLEAGVEIYEFEPRILHAKLLSIDRKWTMIGSANMDIRSFKLNFELNLMVLGTHVAEQARKLFTADRNQSTKVELAQFLRRPLTQQLLENASRLFAPIL